MEKFIYRNFCFTVYMAGNVCEKCGGLVICKEFANLTMSDAQAGTCGEVYSNWISHCMA